MKLFEQHKIDFDNIASVVIIEQTELLKSKANFGFSFGGTPGDGRAMMFDGGSVPVGTQFTFSITYKDGRKQIAKAKAGTALSDRLMQIAMDSQNGGSPQSGTTEDFKPFVLQKNQLPQGDYVIGTDIPEGTFDFLWVFGSGFVSLSNSAENEGERDTVLLQYMSSDSEKYRQLLHVGCKKGYVLNVSGNLVVSIERSKKVVIEV